MSNYFDKGSFRRHFYLILSESFYQMVCRHLVMILQWETQEIMDLSDSFMESDRDRKC